MHKYTFCQEIQIDKKNKDVVLLHIAKTKTLCYDDPDEVMKMTHSELRSGNDGSRNRFGTLIREYRINAGMSQEELGFMIGVGKNAVGAWESGRSRPDLNSISDLCHILNIPLAVFFGRTESELKGLNRDFLYKFRKLNNYNKKVILHEMSALLELQEEYGKEEIAEVVPRKIKLFINDAVAAAGFSPELTETSGQYALFDPDPVVNDADEVIRVNGDSMEPMYSDGELVFVKHVPSVREGEIGIFIHHNAGYIKQYMKDGLHSVNPDYPVMHFTQEDQITCIGKVLGKVDLSRAELNL